MSKKYVIAYHKEDKKNWRFLCIDDGNEVRVVHDYNTRRGDRFLSVTVYSDMYMVENATQEDIDEAMVNKL